MAQRFFGFPLQDRDPKACDCFTVIQVLLVLVQLFFIFHHLGSKTSTIYWQVPYSENWRENCKSNVFLHILHCCDNNYLKLLRECVLNCKIGSILLLLTI